MGAVFRVSRDDEPAQEYALKIIRPGLNRHLLLRRFVREMHILRTLRHPYIARVLDWGVTLDGEPFFVMNLVNGISLNQYCGSHMLSLPERLVLFGKVCEAVEAAHEQGIIHRDLKPANILVGEDGTPVLLDFGVAKIFKADACATLTDITLSQPALMTPQYASPEQIRGESVTPASDIYSLGVLLYELLTGLRPPRVPRRVNPRQLVRTLGGDLGHIVVKALSDDPGRRHSSAGELARDVERYVHRRSKSAERLSRLRRFFVPDLVSRSLDYFARSCPARNGFLQSIYAAPAATPESRRNAAAIL
jgi:serine/threonine protein kinase